MLQPQQDLHDGEVDLPWPNEEEETQDEDVYLPGEEKLPLRATSPKEASHTLWKAQIDHLIERKFCLGLAKKGILGILACVLRFIRLCQAGAKLPGQREERQRSRQQRRQEHLFLSSNLRPTCPSNPSLSDTHSLFCQAVDLTKSSLGIFDHRITSSIAAQPTSADKIFLAPEECYLNLAFSSLCHLYHCPKERRGFTKATYLTEDNHEIKVIEGRRQRQLDNHFGSIVRLRPLQEGSTFERLILSAAHQFSAHNSASSEMSIWGLQIFISNLSRKLNLVVRLFNLDLWVLQITY